MEDTSMDSMAYIEVTEDLEIKIIEKGGDRSLSLCYRPKISTLILGKLQNKQTWKNLCIELPVICSYDYKIWISHNRKIANRSSHVISKDAWSIREKP